MGKNPDTRTMYLRPGESHIVDGTIVHATGVEQFEVTSPTGFGDHESKTTVKGGLATGHYVRGDDGIQQLETIVYETV